MTDQPEFEDETPEIEETPPADKSPKRGGLAVGAAAVGIGSAAVVAALLYARHRKRGRQGEPEA